MSRYTAQFQLQCVQRTRLQANGPPNSINMVHVNGRQNRMKKQYFGALLSTDASHAISRNSTPHKFDPVHISSRLSSSPTDADHAQQLMEKKDDSARQRADRTGPHSSSGPSNTKTTLRKYERVLRAGEIFVLAIASYCLVFSAIVKVVRHVL